MGEKEKVLSDISDSSKPLRLEDLIIPGSKGIGRVFALSMLLFKGKLKIHKVDKTISIR